MHTRIRQFSRLWASVVLAVLVGAGCAHYPLNQPLKEVDPQSGYRGKLTGTQGNSENLLLYLTFSGGSFSPSSCRYLPLRHGPGVYHLYMCKTKP